MLYSPVKLNLFEMFNKEKSGQIKFAGGKEITANL